MPRVQKSWPLSCLAVYLAARRWRPRYAVILTLLAGIVVAAGNGTLHLAGVDVALARPLRPPPLLPPPTDPDSGTTETGGTSDRELQAMVAVTAMIETNIQTLRYCIELSYTENVTAKHQV